MPRTQAHFVSEHDVAVVIPIVHEPVKALQLEGPESVAVLESGWMGLTVSAHLVLCEERHSMEQKVARTRATHYTVAIPRQRGAPADHSMPAATG